MREGMTFVYTSKPGERLKLLPDGSTLVVHPDRPPFLVHIGGHIELLSCSETVHHHEGKLFAIVNGLLHEVDDEAPRPTEIYTPGH